MAGAASTTFAGLGGPGWRELLATAGPDALDLAIRDTELFCRAEAPSLTTWTLDETRAAAVRSPVLSVMGTQSGPFFKEGRQLLHQRFYAIMRSHQVAVATLGSGFPRDALLAFGVASLLLGAMVRSVHTRPPVISSGSGQPFAGHTQQVGDGGEGVQPISKVVG
jgi:hypothetical protein